MKPENPSCKTGESSLTSRLRNHLPLILLGGALSSTLWISRISKETQEHVSQITDFPERDYSGKYHHSSLQMKKVHASDTASSISDTVRTNFETPENQNSPTMTEWLDESDLRSFVESLENIERKLNALERLVKMNNLQKTKELLEDFPTVRSPLGRPLPKHQHVLQCQDHLLKLEKILLSIRPQLSPLEKQKIWESLSFYLLSMNLLNLLEESDHRIQTIRVLLQ